MEEKKFEEFEFEHVGGRTLLEAFNCKKRKGKERSICQNCLSRHTITQEALEILTQEWIVELNKLIGDTRERKDTRRMLGIHKRDCPAVIYFLRYFIGGDSDGEQ